MRRTVLLATLIILCLTCSYSVRADDVLTRKGLDSIKASEAQKYVAVLASDRFEGRNSGYAGCWEAANWISERFKEFGLKPIGDNATYFQEFTFEARGAKMLPGPGNDPGQQQKKRKKKKKKKSTPVQKPHHVTPTTRNVVGLLEGSDPQVKDEVVIIGGHYDHVGREGQWNRGSRRGRPKGKDDICNGADDNASGISAILEIAAAFAESGVKPRRSILFIAFSAEEHGLHGSAWYCEHPLLPLEKTLAMANLDMVGFKSKRPMTIAGVDHASGNVIRKAVTRAMKEVRRFKGRLRPWAMSAGSDHASFVKKSIPTFYFFKGLNNVYHTVEDEVNMISGKQIANVSKVLFLTLIELANLPRKPTFVPGQVHSSGSGRLGIKITGAVSREEAKKLRLKRKQGGVRVDTVYPQSVAGKAGLLPDDIIIRIGKEDLKRGREASTLARVIRKYKPGQRFIIKVVRGKSRKTLRAVMPR